MSDRIASRKYCNTLVSGVFTSDLERCPPWSEINATGKFVIGGTYAINQLVKRADLLAYVDTKKSFTVENKMGIGTIESISCMIGGISQGTISGGASASYTIDREESLIIKPKGLYPTNTVYAVYDSNGVQATISVSTSSEVTLSYFDIKEGETYTVSTGYTTSSKSIIIKNNTGIILVLNDGLQIDIDKSINYTLNSGESITISSINNTIIKCKGNSVNKTGTSISLSYGEVQNGLTYTFTTDSLTSNYITITIYPNKVPFGTYQYQTSNSSSWTTIGTISANVGQALTAPIDYTTGESIRIRNTSQSLAQYCLENTLTQERTGGGSSQLILSANSFSNGDSFSIVSQN